MQDEHNQYYQVKEERRQARRDRLELAAGMSDFFGVIVGAIAILLLILLIISLLNWLQQDISSSFTILNSRL